MATKRLEVVDFVTISMLFYPAAAALDAIACHNPLISAHPTYLQEQQLGHSVIREDPSFSWSSHSSPRPAQLDPRRPQNASEDSIPRRAHRLPRAAGNVRPYHPGLESTVDGDSCRALQ